MRPTALEPHALADRPEESSWSIGASDVPLKSSNDGMRRVADFLAEDRKKVTYRTKILARAATRDDARVLARTLPRPSSIRQLDDGSWAVVQLLPTPWEPRADIGVGG